MAGLSSVGSGLVLLESRDGYSVITLNRPEKRNAVNLALQFDLREAVELSRKANSRAIVICGAPPTFCAGLDLDEQRALRAAGTPVPAQDGHPWAVTQEIIRRHPAVFIAAVSGAAIGGGLTLVHSCELAVAEASSQFSVPEITFGTVPSLSGPASAQRLLSKHAAHLIFLGKRVDAQTALRYGIVNEVVEDGNVFARATEMAELIATYDPVTIDYTKKMFRETPDMSWSAAIDQGIALGTLSRSERLRRSAIPPSELNGGD